MALSSKDIEKAVSKVLHGAEERYIKRLAALLAKMIRRGLADDWSAATIQAIADEWQPRADEITAAHRDAVAAEAVEAVQGALEEAGNADLAALAVLAALAAKGKLKGSGYHAPIRSDAAAAKRVTDIAQQAAKGIAQTLASQNLSMTASAAKAWREAAIRAVATTASAPVSRDALIAHAFKQVGGSLRVAYADGRGVGLDVALRRVMVSEMSRAGGVLTLDALGSVGWELAHTDAHYGARPEHAEWQGLPFGINGAVTVGGVSYPGMAELTGYGTVTGLKGVNCRHVIEIYIPDVTDLPDRNFAEMTDRYGRTSPEQYELVQRQHALERAMRATRYGIAMMQKAGVPDGCKALAQKQLQLSNLDNRLDAFCAASNLRRRKELEQAYGID